MGAAAAAAAVLGEGGRSAWFASSLGSSEPVTAHPRKQPDLACLPASCGAAAAEREGSPGIRRERAAAGAWRNKNSFPKSGEVGAWCRETVTPPFVDNMGKEEY